MNPPKKMAAVFALLFLVAAAPLFAAAPDRIAFLPVPDVRLVLVEEGAALGAVGGAVPSAVEVLVGKKVFRAVGAAFEEILASAGVLKVALSST